MLKYIITAQKKEEDERTVKEFKASNDEKAIQELINCECDLAYSADDLRLIRPTKKHSRILVSSFIKVKKSG